MAPLDDLASTDTNTKDQNSRPSGISYLIGRLDRSLIRHIRTAVSPFGLTTTQYTALSVFAARGQLSNAQFAERTMVSPQAANELMKVMEKNGWIERQPDPSHGRIIQISLTDEGKRLMAQCDAAIAELEHKMLADFSEQEQQALYKQLKALARTLSDI
ncbi:MarR family winged helix-turn-helix transcriptional regulator [Gynuella sp.]|uniref:MarR family winged helix-turn-helix transcriptional regulator n=1 Tax=Gynuella sp. TaxID=2969146 RepID=UPI003D09C590